MNQPYLFDEATMNEITVGKSKVVNVASVPQRSPFRYPGGKTWLVPTARRWFSQFNANSILIEPFCGGGIISLTAVFENFINQAVMIELDNDVASVWQTILSEDYLWLTEQILNFDMNSSNLIEAISNADKGRKEQAFATILRNRTLHGGILAQGSGIVKNGEAGKGLKSRWYPDTLAFRIKNIHQFCDKINFIHGDGFSSIRQNKDDETVCFFIDPPYTVAGKRLYNHYEIDHEKLFQYASEIQGHFLMSYDDTEEVRNLADKYDLPWITIPMQTTHLVNKEEILISDNFNWL